MASTPDAPTARGRRSRANLLDAAAAVFAERGYQATRIADIVERAGMSQGAFYRHYPDKNTILLAVMTDAIDAIYRVTARTDDDWSADEAAIVERNTLFFRAYHEQRGLMRVWREGASVRDSGFEKLWFETRGRFVTRIEEWLERLCVEGEIARTDFTLLAEGLAAVIEQLAFTRIAMADADLDDAALEAMGRAAGELWSRALPRTQH